MSDQRNRDTVPAARSLEERVYRMVRAGLPIAEARRIVEGSRRG